MQDDKTDPAKTYVLSETTLHEVKSLEELAKIAAEQTEQLDIEAALNKGGPRKQEK